MPLPSLGIKNIFPSLKRTSVGPSMRISSAVATGPRQSISSGTPIGLLLALTYASSTAGFASTDLTRPRVRIANT